MYEQIRRNKIKSVLLVIFFVLFISFFIYIAARLLAFGVAIVPIVVTLAILFALFQYFKGDKIVLKISRARPVDKQQLPYLYNVTEGLAIAAGIPMPSLYIIEDTAPNAFATGRDPNHASIAVTTGILQKLNRKELEGVIAHEMSHIKNYDMRLMTIAVVMVGIVALLSDVILRSFLWGGLRSRRKRDAGKATIVIVAIGLLLAILAPLIAKVIQLAISRKREFLADASAAELTRYPSGLASALKKLESDKEPLEAANKATECLYIVNPLKGVKGWTVKLFSTHPPIPERVAALEAM